MEMFSKSTSFSNFLFQQKLKSVFGAVKKGGFIMSLEDVGDEIDCPDLVVIQDHVVEEGRIVLLRKVSWMKFDCEVF